MKLYRVCGTKSNGEWGVKWCATKREAARITSEARAAMASVGDKTGYFRTDEVDFPATKDGVIEWLNCARPYDEAL